MRFPLKINPVGFVLFTGSFLLFFLSARFLGGSFVFLFRFWKMVFFLDTLLFVLNAWGIRYYQDFNRDHISKGDTLTYTLHLESVFELPVPGLSLEFHNVNALGEKKPHRNGKLAIPPGETRNSRMTIHTRLRGVYRIGLARMRVHSYSGLISWDFPIWSRTFYVYPRMVSLPGRGIRKAGSDRDGQLGTQHRETPDVMMGLKEYRPGESLRTVSWKRFRQTGQICLREFSSIGYSRVHLILDRSPICRSPICEDTLLESLMAVADAVIRGGDEVVLYGFPDGYPACLSNRSDLETLNRLSIRLRFDSETPVCLKQENRTGVFLFTALSDYSLLNYRYWQERPDWHLIPVLEEMEEDELKVKSKLLRELKDLNVPVTEVRSAHTIKEDLACLCLL